MKKLLLAVLATVCVSAPALAQSPQITTQVIATAAGTGLSVQVPTTGYHQIAWSVTGTITGCTVSVDSSTDNSSWTAGGAIPNQTCTSGGTSPVVNVSTNYIRIDVVTLTGGGTLKVFYTGTSGISASATVSSVSIGAPAGTCAQGAIDTDKNTGNFYSCNNGVWFLAGGSAAFSALTSGTNAVAAMVLGTGSSLTTSGTGSISSTTGFSATADGVHNGILSEVGNTADAALPSNTANILGPNVATFTAYGLRLPSTGPAAGTVFCTGALVSAISPITFCNPLIAASDGSISAPAFSFTSQTTLGSWRRGTDILAFAFSTGKENVEFQGGSLNAAVKISKDATLQWSNTATDASASPGTGISNDGTNGVLDIGTGTAGAKDGSLNLTNLTATGTVSTALNKTATNCAAVGTAANPSVASCAAAAAGHFSCATNATGGTCTVNTTAVTANSEIFVFESDTAVTGTALSVTCNTGTNVLPTSRLLASSVAATSFTINLGTVTTNPACFSYSIVN